MTPDQNAVFDVRGHRVPSRMYGATHPAATRLITTRVAAERTWTSRRNQLVGCILVVTVLCGVASRTRRVFPISPAPALDETGALETSAALETSVGAHSSRTSKSPHILFILADDLGWNDVSFHNHGVGQLGTNTSHIDELCAAGVTLEQYFTNPICSPSRAAILTGRHVIRYGMQHDCVENKRATHLPVDEVLLPKLLKVRAVHFKYIYTRSPSLLSARETLTSCSLTKSFGSSIYI